MKNALILIAFVGLTGLFVADTLPGMKSNSELGSLSEIAALLSPGPAVATANPSDFGQKLEIKLAMHSDKQVYVKSITCKASGDGESTDLRVVDVNKTFKPGESERFVAQGTPTMAGFRCTVSANEVLEKSSAI